LGTSNPFSSRKGDGKQAPGISVRLIVETRINNSVDHDAVFTLGSSSEALNAAIPQTESDAF
jgi:hypothetical protein